MSSSIDLADFFEPTLLPILRLKPSFLVPDGIFSPFERKLLSGGGPINVLTTEPRKNLITEFCKSQPKLRNCTISIEAQHPANNPAKLLQNIGSNIEADISLIDRNSFVTSKRHIPCPIQGSYKDVLIHREAIVSPQACIDATKGSVVIDKQAQISAFSLIKGPAYIGPATQVDKALIANSRIGTNCRIGGEVSDTIIGDFSNKHHEGFVGHSILGDWVNLGALTTTSDLKNNYGLIKLHFEQEEFPTETIKLGSVIGDYVKTAIGTMLNTGTIIDFGGLLFSGRPDQKYYPPFFWGGVEPTVYEANRFIQDIKKVMARRKQTPSDFAMEQINLLHSGKFST